MGNRNKKREIFKSKLINKVIFTVKASIFN